MDVSALPPNRGAAVVEGDAQPGNRAEVTLPLGHVREFKVGGCQGFCDPWRIRVQDVRKFAVLAAYAEGTPSSATQQRTSVWVVSPGVWGLEAQGDVLDGGQSGV